MKPKHTNAYLKQCLANAELSPCPRRKYGAVAVDPDHNVVITAGYNGTPRGAYSGADDALCGGAFCLREVLKPEDLEVTAAGLGGKKVWVKGKRHYNAVLDASYDWKNDCQRPDDELLLEACAAHLPVESGTHYEVGCHHAEANVVANAARLGRSLAGAWVFCSGMPCLGCARLLHHAGVVRVITIEGGYAAGAGGYLKAHKIEVVEVPPPFDLRAGVEAIVRELDGDEHAEWDAETVENVARELRLLLQEAGAGTGPLVDPRKKAP